MKSFGRTTGGILKNPPLILGVSFLILIFIGAILLNLPIASSDGKSVGFIDALFTASSASCVTGLIVRNTAAGWSMFGKIVILSLIQIGGLGTMTIIAMISVFAGKKIGLRERMMIREQLNTDTLSGLVRLIEFVIVSALLIESIGAIILSTSLIPIYGVENGIKLSIFHSISAFCNAGFDLFGDSLLGMQDNWVVNLTIASLVIVGGLGFAVFLDIRNYKARRRFTTHTKLVLITTAFLLLFGMVLFYILECNNPLTMGHLSTPNKWLASFFQSTIMRTAGFNSINIAGMRDSSLFIAMILMFIGGSPGSTAGGLKTTTFAIMMKATITTLKENKDTEVLKRKVSNVTVKKVYALFFTAISLVCIVVISLTVFEGDKFAFNALMFETVSAFGTVGVSKGITADLSSASKLIISLTMFLGRVGPTTFAIGLFHSAHKKKYKYAEGRFIVG